MQTAQWVFTFYPFRPFRGETLLPVGLSTGLSLSLSAASINGPLQPKVVGAITSRSIYTPTVCRYAVTELLLVAQDVDRCRA